jgi:hypothetical protein
MRKQILSIATVLALTAAGALMAQAPQNTTAPGPTMQQEPGQTNNNLPNPGNPQTNLQNQNSGTAPTTGTTPSTTTTMQDRTGQEQDEVDIRQGVPTTSSAPLPGDDDAATTGTLAPETEQGEGMDVDVDTGDRASGAVDVDVTRTTDADTDASGIDETGSLGDQDTTTTGAYGDQDALPSTASELPMVALFGLIALASAFALRRARRA